MNDEKDIEKEKIRIRIEAILFVILILSFIGFRLFSKHGHHIIK